MRGVTVNTMQRAPLFLDNSPEVAARKHLGRNDSKVSHLTCHGINSSNGKPCRRAISPQKGLTFCYLHKSQNTIITSSSDGFPGLQVDAIDDMTIEKLDVEASLPTVNTRTKPVSRPSIAGIASGTAANFQTQSRDPDSLPGTARQSDQQQNKFATCQEEAEHDSFDLRNFLRMLLCIPKEKISPDPSFTPLYHQAALSQSPPAPKVMNTIQRKPIGRLNSPCHSIGIRYELESSANSKHTNHFDMIAVPGPDGKGCILRLSEWIPRGIERPISRRIEDELRKVASKADVDGYIYVFRLVETKSKAKLYNSARDERIMLKIGRTDNVQRRLYQWSNQCSHTPELLDYFQTPCSHKVERLVHLELSKHKSWSTASSGGTDECCSGCGKTHREWFSIEAHQARHRVNETIGRWIRFTSTAYGSQTRRVQL